ncbi:ubiquitin-like domain-containing protein [Streptomyces sp. XM4193]|uniref:ubiquitin-like domain-containing protein n=1 Tax=Streptomyces sp. XM4193 TaxID=2929782 RepID=UPI001FFA7E8C|nr:resuscitation-promoting factor [Streptomyces sp. XM4193]MCK1796829.1 ubiquitin-like domain-containing protein [Streptomyces sp. XM4193]
MNSSQASHRAARGGGRHSAGSGPSKEPDTGGERRRSVSPAARAGGETLRKLLPQALVLAVLAGGTSAFVAHDKVVELSVDGETTSLRTFASSVSELLEDEDVEVGPRDLVAPGAHESLSDGDRIAVRYGRPMNLTVDGRAQRMWTTERTVEGALRQLGVRAEGAHLSTSRSKRIGLDGLRLAVRTERSVSFLADGKVHRVRTNAPTVRGALAQAGLRLRDRDTVSVPLRSFPREGQEISVQRVRADKKVTEEMLPFAVERRRTSELHQGTEVVEQQGRQGVRRVTYELRTVDGRAQKPRLLGSEVVREPRRQIVRVGTRPKPASVATVRGSGGLNWAALARCESGGRVNAVDPSGTYGGLYQFDVRTWQSVGGAGRPQDASAQEQTLRAQKLYAQRGASPWPVCGRKLHQ